MQITSQLTKAIKEAKYMTVTKHMNYRVIIRFLYLQLKNMNYWTTKEEVFSVLKDQEGFENYTIEECESDLESLVDFDNLTKKQETGYAATINDFLKKNFSYQIKPTTQILEETLIQLEQLNLEGSSLNTVFLEKFKDLIKEFYLMSKIDNDNKKDLDRLGSWWQDLLDSFKNINTNYTNYISLFYKLETEETMNAETFLMYKEKLMEHISGFIRDLQAIGDSISREIRKIPQDTEADVLNSVVKYYLDQQITGEVTEEQILKEILMKWNNVKVWFLGSESKLSEKEKILNKTKDIIRKITDLARKLIENKNSISNREQEYDKLIELFSNTDSIEDAHKLSAYVFGINSMKHIQIDSIRETEKTDMSVYEENLPKKILKPRTRKYREKSQKTPIKDKTVRKKEAYEVEINKRNEVKNKIESCIIDGEIAFNNLPIINRDTRFKLIEWVTKGIHENRKNPNKLILNEYGQLFKLIEPKNNERCIVRCEDGELDSPAFVIEFIKKEESKIEQK